MDLKSTFTLYADAPVRNIFSVIDSSAFPDNRLKVVVNKFNTLMCLSSRSETLLQTIEKFVDDDCFVLQEKFIKTSLLGHLNHFHDNGAFAVRLTKALFTACSNLEVHRQILAKLLALFRKLALLTLTVEPSHSTTKFPGAEQLDFETCKPLIHLVLSILCSKKLICGSISCNHAVEKCLSFEVAVSIVRTFLLSLDSDHPRNNVKFFPITSVSLPFQLFEGLVIKVSKAESIDAVEKWSKFNKPSDKIRCIVFSENSPVLANFNKDDDKEDKREKITSLYTTSLASAATVHFNTTIVELISSLGISVIFCQKVVDAELIYECARRSILVFDRLGAEDCFHVQTLLGTSMAIWPTTASPDGDIANMASNTGFLDDIEVSSIGNSRNYVHLKSSSNIDFRTLIISSPTQDLLPDIKALCELALANLKMTMISRRTVLKGAGVWQVELANEIHKKVVYNIDSYCRDFALLPVQVRRCIFAFCSALAQTGIRVDKGLVSILNSDLLSSLEKSVIVDYENWCSDENKDNFIDYTKKSSERSQIYDCLLSCRSAFDTAVSCVLTLLTTDKFIDEKSTRRCLDNAKQFSL